MNLFSSLMKFIVLLTLINISLFSLCGDFSLENFEDIDNYKLTKINVGPNKENCFKYKLSDNKNKISLTFMNGYLRTGEVLIYDSLDKIKNDKSEFINYRIKYIIADEAFKEIDITNNIDYVYIIIRDSKNYYFNDYIILYDSEKKINLKEGIPLTINNFMSNSQYIFSFKSNKNVTIVYTSRNKGHKILNIDINGIHNNEINDKDDILLKYENNNLYQNEYEISIKNETNNENDNEFSLIYYENLDEFKKINKNDNIEINYLINNNKAQYFYFYLDISDYKSTSSINYKLDYRNKNKSTEYINITSKVLLKNDDIINSSDFDKNFANELDYVYDLGSDIYLKSFFTTKNKNEKYKYILIKIKIIISNYYYRSKSFFISYGNEVENIKIEDKQYQQLEIKSESYIPTYTKLLFNIENKYLLNIPYDNEILLINGDILNKKEKLNKNYINNSTDLLIIDKIEEITISLFGYQNSITLNIEKFDFNDVIIIHQRNKTEEAFNHTYTKEECNPAKLKYIIFLYDINIYLDGFYKSIKYWTSDEKANMNINYKNKNDFEDNTIFPSSKYEIEKEKVFLSNSHLDIYSIKCNSPGTLYIRPLKKQFEYKTTEITQNSISIIKLTSQTEMLQLSSPIKNPPTKIFFSILLLDNNNLNITPDTPGLFEGKKLKKGDFFFSITIDSKKYRMDEMAIKISSNDNPQIEITETTDFEITQYQEISKEKKEINIKKNNFIIFLNERTKTFKLKFNIINNEKMNATYGIVRLATKKKEFIPTADKFKDGVKEEEIDNKKTIELLNISYSKKDNIYRPFQAFIFSIKSNYTVPNFTIEYKTIKSKKKEKKYRIIIFVSNGLSFIIAFIFFIFIFKLNKKGNLNLELYESLD